MRDITVVVPVSPIRSHPSTTILDETLDSVRYHLPDSEIILCFDGVRAEQQARRADYERHIQTALWRADKIYGDILPLIFDTHHHQTGMMRETLRHIESPMLLYVEQDTPLVTDEPIDWPAVTAFIRAGDSCCVRFHHEAVIPADHQHMMHGDDRGFLRTSQWSQRPHLASTAFYERIMATCFTPNARSFIEDRMHSVIDQAHRTRGILGWTQYRTHIYNPVGNIKRSYHTDGRDGDLKYDGTQVF